MPQKSRSASEGPFGGRMERRTLPDTLQRRRRTPDGITSRTATTIENAAHSVALLAGHGRVPVAVKIPATGII